MAVSSPPLDVKGSVSNTLASALSSLTNGVTECLFIDWVNSATTPGLNSGSGSSSLATRVGTGCGLNVVRKLAGGTTDTGGTSSGATIVQAMAFNGAGAISNVATNAGATANPVFPALTLLRTDGTSSVIRYILTMNTTVNTATLTNYTMRDGNGVGPATHAWVAGFERAAVTSNPTADSITLATGTNGWITVTVEIGIPAGGNTGQFFAMF